MKYQATERMRGVVNDAMDIHGGRGICDGPTNYLLSAYQMVPVGITVEGANILTRTLITFAQGALRAHPFLYQEVLAAQNPDRRAGLAQFDEAFGNHIAFSLSNAGALFHNLTGGLFGEVPERAYGTAEWYRQLWRQSRNFALVADMSVALLGGGLKTRQKITGRMADALSELYLLACVLKRYEDDGKPPNDRHVVAFAARNGLYRGQEALRGAIDNFPVPAARVLMRFLVFPFGRPYRPASDRLGSEIVRLATTPGDVRDRLTRYIHVSHDPDDPAGLLEVALAKVIAAEEAERSSSGRSAPARCAATTASTGSATPPLRASSPRARRNCCARPRRSPSARSRSITSTPPRSGRVSNPRTRRRSAPPTASPRNSQQERGRE